MMGLEPGGTDQGLQEALGIWQKILGPEGEREILGVWKPRLMRALMESVRRSGVKPP